MCKTKQTFTRRGLMAGIACIPVAAKAATPALSPDVGLVSLGCRFHELTFVLDELARSTNHTFQDIVTLVEALRPIESAIVCTPAKTISGLIVKAQAAYWEREGRINPEHEQSASQKLAWSIVRDLISLSRPQSVQSDSIYILG